MCGIVGFAFENADGVAPDQRIQAEVTAMAGRLVHRGPDDSGVWLDS